MSISLPYDLLVSWHTTLFIEKKLKKEVPHPTTQPIVRYRWTASLVTTRAICFEMKRICVLYVCVQKKEKLIKYIAYILICTLSTVFLLNEPIYGTFEAQLNHVLLGRSLFFLCVSLSYESSVVCTQSIGSVQAFWESSGRMERREGNEATWVAAGKLDYSLWSLKNIIETLEVWGTPLEYKC